jgi:hypothetical protein
VGKKYETTGDGSPVDLDWRDRHYLYLACCDCGLVHKITVVATKRRARLRFWRDNRRTGQLRRHSHIKLVEERVES